MLRSYVSLMRGRVLEAFLKAERGLASCGRGSHPQPREVRGNDGWVLRPSCEEFSLQASAPMPEWEARVPGPKIAEVERRKASGPWRGPRRASPARHNLRLSALRRPSFGAAKKVKTRTLRRRGNGICCAKTKALCRCGVRNASQGGYRFQITPATLERGSRRGPADASACWPWTTRVRRHCSKPLSKPLDYVT